MKDAELKRQAEIKETEEKAALAKEQEIAAAKAEA